MSYIKICLKLTYMANQQQKHSRKRSARIISRMMRAMAAARGTTSNPPHHRYTIYNANQYKFNKTPATMYGGITSCKVSVNGEMPDGQPDGIMPPVTYCWQGQGQY